MPIFNFKKFNESISNSSSLTEDHRLILQDIIEDVWTMQFDVEAENTIDRPFRQRSAPEVRMGNIALRSSITLSPGHIASIVDYRLSPGTLVNKSNVYGFSIRTTDRYDSLLKRALDLFKRQTGIQLDTHVNDERQTIIAEPNVIKFINNVLNFENDWENLPYMLPGKYQEEVEIMVEPWDLEMQLEFTAKNRNSQIVGCYIDIKLTRGVVIGGDLPLNDIVKYDLKIGSLCNFEEKRDTQSVWQFAKSHKDDEYQFEFDVVDEEGSTNELLQFFEKSILSQIELPGVKLRSEIESQLNKLKQWSIKSEFEYIKTNLIEVFLNWKGEQYQFYLNIEDKVSIKQEESLVDKSSVEDLAETIYLCLIEGRLKIVQ